MPQKLFKTGKTGCFVESYAPGVEKRRGEEVSVITIKFKVMPFDAKLAVSLDDGVGGDSNIRATVFSISTTDPKPNFTRHDFRLGLVRQNLEIFAAPDTRESRVMLLQAKISGTYVRSQKDVNALAMIFKATFGPVGRDELELIHSLHRSQAFISFHESQPLVDDDMSTAAEATKTDAAEDERPPHMFKDERDVQEPARHLPRRNPRRGKV